MGLDISCKCGKTEFRAGSYSGYNWWREILAEIAGISDIKKFWMKAGSVSNRKGSEPFFELINFSDCEGTLPFRECKRLLEDFDTFAKIIHGKNPLFWTMLFSSLNISQDDWDYWKEKYDRWHEAVRHAVKDKCNIQFH